MAVTLPCESTLSYTHKGQSHTGTGATEAAARQAALDAFGAGAEAQEKNAATDDANESYECVSPCEHDITVGSASFVQTLANGGGPNNNDWSVTVQIQSPVTVECRRREVSKIALVFSPVEAAAIALASLEIREVHALESLQDPLTKLGIRTVRDLLARAELKG